MHNQISAPRYNIITTSYVKPRVEEVGPTTALGNGYLKRRLWLRYVKPLRPAVLLCCMPC